MKGFFTFILFIVLVNGQTPTDTPSDTSTTNTPTDTPTIPPTDTPTNTPTDTTTTTTTTTAGPTTTPTDTLTTTTAPTTTNPATPTDTPTGTPTDTPTDTPCVVPLPSTPLCGTKPEEGKGVSIYSLGPYVCLVIVGSGDCTSGVYATQNKTVFRPKVDDFTSLQVANSHSTNVSGFGKWIAASDVHVRVEIANITSSWKRRISGSNVVPFWTALIRVSRGTVTAIDWDDGCWACDAGQCVDNTCGVNRDDCYEVAPDGTVIQAKDTNCDLSVYVGWSGSDSGGNIFTSNSKRLSAFRSYSIFSVYNTARQSAPAIDPKIPCVSKQIQGCTQ